MGISAVLCSFIFAIAMSAASSNENYRLCFSDYAFKARSVFCKKQAGGTAGRFYLTGK